MLWGESWSPEMYLAAHCPQALVVDTDRLPAGVLGGVDHARQVIWLAVGQPECVRRCTLAFEIGRLECGPTGGDQRVAVANNRAAAEWAARMMIDSAEFFMAFAACSQLPARQLYTELARLLGVDVPTVRARLRGMTDDEQDAVTDALRNLPVTV